MVYDQNRPDEPQRPSGEERPARRRIGRSWGPPPEEAAEVAEEARQGMGQPPEQYRFDPDRGRRHRYSEDPTGQVPNVPVEIAETGPMVPATRRPTPGEQFEPLPAAPQTPQGPQGPQGFPNDQSQQAQQQPQSPFAPPPAPPNVPQGPPQDFGVPPQQYLSAPQDFGAAPQQHLSAPQDFGMPQQHPGYSAPPTPGDYAAQQQQQQQGQGLPQPGPNQEFGPPGTNHEYSGPPGANHEYNAQPGANQDFSAPPGANQNYSAPQQFSAPPQASALPSAPPTGQSFAAPAPEYAAPTTPPEPVPPHPEPQGTQEHAAMQQPGPPQHTGPIQAPQQTGPIQIPQPPAPQAPVASPTPAAQPQIPVAEQQTEQFPIVQQQHVTAVSPAPVPSPPVTEQAPLRTAPANRQPFAEPTPPANVEKSGLMPGPTAPTGVNDPESARLVDAVRQVPGVRDAFHVTAPDGASSLRLELEEGVDPDQVHAVVSAVVAEQRAVEPGPQTADEPGEQFNSHVESPSTEVEIASIGPVELRRVEIESAGLEAEVSVTLALGDAESTGKVAVPPIDWHIQHAAAAATVEALRPRLGASDVRVEVEHASIVPTGPVKTAVVVILWLDGRSVRRLSGAAVVTAERSRAVVSATLGALAAEVSH